MKKNNSLLLSTPYIIWMVVFTLIPLGVVGYYALTDPATGAFTFSNIRSLPPALHMCIKRRRSGIRNRLGHHQAC